VKECSEQFPVAELCRVAAVSTSGYYGWLKRPPSLSQKRREELRVQIKTAHAQSRQTYGSPRVYQELKERGVEVCENTVAKLMRLNAVRAKTPRRYVPCTTDARHALPVAQNVLERNFTAQTPNEKWVADITYVPTGEGWLYVAAVLDLYSRKIVGWSMAEHLRTDLVAGALALALGQRRPGRELLHHSDRGVQYASAEYQGLLAAHGCVCSMSRTGNCYDNAVMESFWKTLKTELVCHEQYATRDAARRSIFEYIEVFYNRVRRHSSLGYVSPEAFEAALN